MIKSGFELCCASFPHTGYLLYNFAGIFPVDFTYKQTRLFLFLHMAVVTFIFMAPMLAIMGLYKVGEVKLITHTGKSLLGSTEVSVHYSMTKHFQF